MNKEKIYELYYENIVPLLISDFELECNYENKMFETNKTLKELVVNDIKNDFENNIKNIIFELNYINDNYDKNSLEHKKFEETLKEIKKVYDIQLEEMRGNK